MFMINLLCKWIQKRKTFVIWSKRAFMCSNEKLFPTNYKLKQQNPDRAKIARPRAKSLRLDPSGRGKVINVWLSH